VACQPIRASLPRKVKKPSVLATLMEFLAPSTHEPERVHLTPGCHTGYVPSSGFLTLATAFSSLERSALFHAVTPMGFRSSGVFPHRQVPQLVTTELPSWRSKPLIRPEFTPQAMILRSGCEVPAIPTPERIATSAAVAFKALLRRRIRIAARLLHRSKRPIPS